MKSKTKSHQTAKKSATMKILIADDDKATRILLRQALTQWGYEVIEAPDGEAAWEMINQPNPPHLLILDWVMPKLDGISLCKRIEQNFDQYHPYIIFLTQKSGTENIVEGLESGADEFLLKPFDLPELRIRIFAGERIIQYRNQLMEKNKELKNFIEKSKTPKTSLIPFADLIILLQKIYNTLNPVCNHLLDNPHNNEPAIQKIRDLQNQLTRIIEVIKAAENNPETIKDITNIETAPIAKSSQPMIDMDRMSAFFGDDKAAIWDFISTFITLAKEQIEEIHQAVKNHDIKMSKYYFHLLGSASGNSGIMEIYKICGRAEAKVTEADWDAANQCYIQLIDVVERLEIELKNHQK